MKLTKITAFINVIGAMSLNSDKTQSRPLSSMLIQTEDANIPTNTIYSDSNSTDEIGEGVITQVSATYTDFEGDQNDEKFEIINDQKINVSRIGNLSFA